MGDGNHSWGIARPAAEPETIDEAKVGRPWGLPSSDFECVGALLAENIGDYISLGLFAYLLEVHRPATVRDVRGHCLQSLDHLIREEYVLVGTVLGTSFVPWVLGPAQLGEAVAAQWPRDSSADYDKLRDIAWLSNTAKGDAVARDYLLGRARSASRSSLPSLPEVLKPTDASRSTDARRSRAGRHDTP